MLVESFLWVENPMHSNYFRLSLVLVIAGFIGIVVGCRTNKNLITSFAPDNVDIPAFGASYIRPTEPAPSPVDPSLDVASLSPDAMIDYLTIQYTPITLGECIHRALHGSEVFRDLGGTIVAQSAAIETSLDPALRYTNPTFGEDAALSAFDANLVTGLFFENNDRPFNNRFSGNPAGLLTQELGEYSFEISKLAATGTLFTSRTRINYDGNNQAGNRFGSAWEAIIDSGFRHPLLQGSGSMFNRIAGPSQAPGSYNGVLIARTNTEISLADFEESSREFVSNVENAYWDLYYAYRELNAQTKARDAALDIYRKTKAKSENQQISSLETSSAKEQYLRFESAIIESLEGRLIEGTQVDSGSSGGSFRRTVGVRVAERRLRYIIGMPITDGTLLQPADQPGRAPSVFDWDTSVASALGRRPEVRRQRWIVKQKELELTAARNFLLPRLDLVGNYRFRGLGKHLSGGSTTLQDDITNGTDLSDAFSDLSSGNFQEVQIGAELRMPIGYRRANAGVRNAELFVQREHAVLKEQERHIVLNLSNAIAEARRSHSAMMMAEERFSAANDYRKQAETRINLGRSQMNVLLEAQRRMLEAQIQFINAEVDYVIAIKNVHYEKGTFLQYHGVILSESESNPRAYIDYDRRVADRGKLMSYIVRDASIGNSPLADAIGIGSRMEIVDMPASDASVEPPLVPEFKNAIPLATGVETPAQEIEVPIILGSESPTDAIPVQGTGVIPPTPTTFQSTQSEIEWHAPPTANLVPQTAQVTSPVTKNSAPVASNRVVLSDEPASGRQVEGLGKVVPTVEIISDTVSSRKTTNQRQLAQPAQPGNRVYKGDISTTDANLAPGTDVAAQNRPVIMNISSPPPALESTDTKPAQVSFSDKPGFTILKPMYEASEASEKSRLQKSNRRQPTGIRISDTNSGESNESQIQIR